MAKNAQTWRTEPLSSKRLLGLGSILTLVLVGLELATPALAATPAEMGSGAAWLDCDNDGDLDILVLDPLGSVKLFVHDPSSDTFTDVTDGAIPLRGQLNRPLQGAACGDLTDDGYPDIFLSLEGANYLMINDGYGRFKTATRTAGIVGEDISSSVALLDYNNDGLLDIYVANYMNAPNQFYRNDGVDGAGIPHFTDVAPELGMDLAGEGLSDWTRGLAVADYDNDGDVDLYLANDSNGTMGGVGLDPGLNILYRNNGDGTFTDVSYASGTADPGWAMGVAFGDYNNDGWQDIFVANFWEDALLKNNGDGTFSNITRGVGLITDKPDEWHHSGWGSAFVDFDNDGDLDIHVSNGYIRNDEGQVLNEPNQLWENLGESGQYHFQEIGAKAGIGDVGDARGAAYGDFNEDGLMDMLVINNGWLANEEIIESPRRMLYVNQGDGTFQDEGYRYGLRDEMVDPEKPPGYRDDTQNSWVEVGLEGVDSNRSAVGSRVTVKADSKTWVRDFGASSYCSESSPLLHFGLGNATRIDELSARFPSGRVQTYRGVSVNRIYTITEPMETPVRLLSFDLASVPEGVLIRWSYSDDGDLVSFSVRREVEGVSEDVAFGIPGHDDRAEVLDPDAPTGVELLYTLEALTRNGRREILRTQTFRHEPPARSMMGQNFPNPFRAVTAIPVASPPGGVVDLVILDASGRQVRLLRSSVPAEGGVVRWDGKDESGRPLPAGVYFYSFLNSEDARPLKMTLKR
jgi:hypothetical protein